MFKYHKTQFVTEFSNYYRRCADPLRSHKNVVKTSLHEITLEKFRLYCIPHEILPGDPLRSHKNVVKTSLHEITLEEFRLYCTPYEILPGRKLCFRYKNKVCVEKKENENVDIELETRNEVMETGEISHETANGIVNQSLEMLECSSLKVLRSDRILSIDKRKIKDVTTKF